MQTLNALFGVAYVREHLKSRTSVGQPWATDTPSLGASLFKCPVTRLSRNLLISPFKSRNRPGQVPGTSDASKTQSGLIRSQSKELISCRGFRNQKAP